MLGCLKETHQKEKCEDGEWPDSQPQVHVHDSQGEFGHMQNYGQEKNHQQFLSTIRKRNEHYV